MSDTASEPFRILIADDESVLLRLFSIALLGPPKPAANDETDATGDSLFRSDNSDTVEPPKYELTCCQQGDEALEAFQAAIDEGRPFSTIFLDVRMPPGPTGVAVAEWIRKLDGTVPIVIVSGFSDVPPKEIKLRVPPESCIEYIEKPCRMNKIRDVAARLTQQWADSRP